MEAARKTDFKYKIGKVKQTPSVQKDPKTGLSFIQLKATPDEKVYGCTKFSGHYKEEKKLGQGTFGEVYKGTHLETQRQVAMKRIIINVEKDLFPITAQREITILRRLDHKNVIKLIEVVYDYSPSAGDHSEQQQPSTKSSLSKSFYMILPYMVSDLSGILHNPRINLQLSDIKNMMLQLLEGINYIHCQKYMHRDIKAANILIDHNGVLKLADFGLARVYYGAPPNLRFPGGAGSGAKYTSVVVTRWYRAPELVLGDKTYTTAVDIWGVGCVFAEFFEKKPILQGSSDIDQGHVIFKLLGTPSEADWPLARYLPGAELTRTKYPGNLKERFGSFLSDAGLDFLRKLLALDPYKRLTAMSAVHHPFFKEDPLPSDRLALPNEESHESDIKRYKEEMQQAMSQKAPSAPQGHVIETGNFPKAPKPPLPKAPARNAFPKGPAAMPGAKAPLKGHSNSQPQNRTSSRYENGTGVASNAGYRAGPTGGYRETSRYNPNAVPRNPNVHPRVPPRPQGSRYDARPAATAGFNQTRPRLEFSTDRSKTSSQDPIDKKAETKRWAAQPKAAPQDPLQMYPALPQAPAKSSSNANQHPNQDQAQQDANTVPSGSPVEPHPENQSGSKGPSNIADFY
ncbi:hypothetical protein HG536_0F00610 [Torulaspora globosa]|uniref:Serine/threonine-protein kinase BUR1 n=1 Tax=Torulaspora globosa TaxID=48254 RepID=A0A7G3ZJQ0_9SACH|nr:uncharacterized protein HG536_0F00610 [Torulaspora globosa]QLL33736.1 hypothetical protein HG536_0F00610 [Torulaspora globosa]